MPSSVVSAILYYPDTFTLRIVFVSGMVYDYERVPEKVYKKMKAATSKGAFLNDHIKGTYDFKKVSD